MPLYCTMVNACERIGSCPIRSYRPQTWGRNRSLLRKRRKDQLRRGRAAELPGGKSFFAAYPTHCITLGARPDRHRGRAFVAR